MINRTLGARSRSSATTPRPRRVIHSLRARHAVHRGSVDTLGARVARGRLPGVDGGRLPIVADRAAAVAAGHTESAVTRRLANGRWAPLRRGAFWPSAELGADQRWRAEVVAAAGAFAGELVLSHAHAARAYGLPQP